MIYKQTRLLWAMAHTNASYWARKWEVQYGGTFSVYVYSSIYWKQIQPV